MTTSDPNPAPVTWRTKPVPEAVYLGLTAASVYTDIARDTLRRRIADGSLPAYKFGNRGDIRIRVTDLEALMVPVRVVKA